MKVKDISVRKIKRRTLSSGKYVCQKNTIGDSDWWKLTRQKLTDMEQSQGREREKETTTPLLTMRRPPFHHNRIHSNTTTILHHSMKPKGSQALKDMSRDGTSSSVEGLNIGERATPPPPHF